MQFPIKCLVSTVATLSVTRVTSVWNFVRTSIESLFSCVAATAWAETLWAINSWHLAIAPSTRHVPLNTISLKRKSLQFRFSRPQNAYCMKLNPASLGKMAIRMSYRHIFSSSIISSRPRRSSRESTVSSGSSKRLSYSSRSCKSFTPLPSVVLAAWPPGPSLNLAPRCF